MENPYKKQIDEVASLDGQIKEARKKGDKNLTEELIYRQEEISRGIMSRLRSENPNSFRVFEFNGPNQPHEEPTTGINSRSTFGTIGRTKEVLDSWIAKYGIKQNDILIFHPTEHSKFIQVFYMIEDNEAISSPIVNGKISLPDIDEVLEILGLTPLAAQRLWFPRGGLPIFSRTKVTASRIL